MHAVDIDAIAMCREDHIALTFFDYLVVQRKSSVRLLGEIGE